MAEVLTDTLIPALRQKVDEASGDKTILYDSTNDIPKATDVVNPFKNQYWSANLSESVKNFEFIEIEFIRNPRIADVGSDFGWDPGNIYNQRWSYDVAMEATKLQSDESGSLAAPNPPRYVSLLGNETSTKRYTTLYGFNDSGSVIYCQDETENNGYNYASYVILRITGYNRKK